VKKSTLIILALGILASPALRAEVGLEDAEGVPVGSVPQAPPLLLAQSLPGMGGRSVAGLLEPLPRIHAPSASLTALPQPLISDLMNYPNPFDTRKPGNEGHTHIVYQLFQDSKVSLEIFDLLGHRVRGWEFFPGSNGGRLGANDVVWDGTNGAGRKVSKGGYIAQIVIEAPHNTVTVTRKIAVIH